MDYKIKESMDKEHRECLAQLKKSYELALLNHKKDEQIALDRVKKANEQYQELLLKIKSLESDKVKIEKEISDISTKKREIDDGLKKLARERELFAYDSDLTRKELDNDRKSIALSIKSSQETIATIRKEAEIKAKDADSKLKMAESIKSNADNTLEKANRILQDVEKREAEIFKIQANIVEITNKNNEALNANAKALKDIVMERDEIDRASKRIEQRSLILDKIEKEQKSENDRIKDKLIDIEVREADIARLEKRVNNLIQIHNLKDKVCVDLIP